MSSSIYQPGQVVGAYQLVRLQHSDDDGERWLARRTDAAGVVRPFGILLAPGRVEAARQRAWLEPLVRIAAELAHPNIEAFVESALDADPAHLVFAWAEGATIEELEESLELLAQTRRDAWAAAIAHVVAQVAAGLAHAHGVCDVPGHGAGVVHRQLAPTRVFVTVEGDVIVRGFGIAARPHDDTSGVHVHGLLRYLPAEQLGARVAAPTMDLFALGGLLHELLDGRRFRAAFLDAPSLYRAIAGGEVSALGRVVEPTLASVRGALLLPVGSGRWTSGAQVADALRGFADGRTHCAALVRGLLDARRAPSEVAESESGPATVDHAIVASPPAQVVAARAADDATIALSDEVLANLRRGSTRAPAVPAPAPVASEPAVVVRTRPSSEPPAGPARPLPVASLPVAAPRMQSDAMQPLTTAGVHAGGGSHPVRRPDAPDIVRRSNGPPEPTHADDDEFELPRPGGLLLWLGVGVFLAIVFGTVVGLLLSTG